MDRRSLVVITAGVFLLVAAILFRGAPATPAAPVPPTATPLPTGQKLLNELIAKAKQEGTATVEIPSSFAVARIPDRLRSAFRERFGLDIRPDAFQVGGSAEAPKFSQLKTRQTMGLPPTHDAMEGGEINHVPLIREGRALKIEGWRELLAVVNPMVASGMVGPQQISRSVLDGHSFAWTSRTKIIAYNPKRISREDLPKTWRDLADPKYKGLFTVPPWTTEVEYLPLKYGKVEALEIVKRIGKNATGVLPHATAMQRIAIGEITMIAGNLYMVFEMQAKDPGAPIDWAAFNDYTPVQGIYYVVPKGARSPAAGMLWSLWMTTPEAQKLYQPDSFWLNVPFGQSALDQKAREALRRAGSPQVTFFDNETTLALFDWYATDEGRKYIGQMRNALRGKD